MSKATLRKALKDFDAQQMQALLLDVYSKSKEAKEILDFFAEPDIEKKTEEYRTALTKEATRYTRRAYRPRLPRLRSTLKRFRTLEPGDEAVAELMVDTSLTLIGLGKDSWLRDQLYDNIAKFFAETMAYIAERDMTDDFMPRIRKARESLSSPGFMRRNPLARIMDSEIEKYLKQ